MSPKDFINPWIGASDSNTTGAGNPAASGTTTTTGAGAGLSGIAGNSTVLFKNVMLGSLKMELSTEERKELDDLTKQYEADVKVLRLEEFKKAPTHLRQMVIDSHDWQEVVNKIDNITIQPQADRLTELRAKDLSNSQWLQPLNMLTYPNPFQAQYGSPLQLPAGLTLQELEDAHSERCLEEEML